jgi:hypothetical protein
MFVLKLTKKSGINKDFVTKQMLRSYRCDLKILYKFRIFATPLSHIQYQLTSNICFYKRTAMSNVKKYNLYYYFNGGSPFVTFED